MPGSGLQARLPGVLHYLAILTDIGQWVQARAACQIAALGGRRAGLAYRGTGGQG
jgi:hypothetical protein